MNINEILKSIKCKVFNFGRYYIMWVIFFVIARGVFMAYHYPQTMDLSISTIASSFLYGLILDFSFAGYLSVLPFIVYTLSFWWKRSFLLVIVKIYTIIFASILSLLMIIDMDLYGAWGIRLDSTPITYLNTPKEMMASISYSHLMIALIFLAGFLFGILRLFRWITKGIKIQNNSASWVEIPLYLLLIGGLMIPIRGGFQTIPINQSNVYFSNQMYANHSAINFAWNFTHSLIDRTYDTSNPFVLLDQNKATQLIIEKTAAVQKHLTLQQKSEILNVNRPNVLFIIWEGLTAKAVGPLGGLPNVTENLNRYAKEGLLFTNFYANGDRTDKGLICLLSGYYPQTQKSIIKVPNKSKSLPMLPKEIANLGYETAFYYGGNTNFGNMNTYLKSAKISNIIGGSFFEKDSWNSKWGAHDHIVFDRMLKDFAENKTTQPFFKTVLTLTSHEPYEFPGEQKFGMDTKENKYLSSLAYTDRSLGDFLDEAKKQSWWDNTLVIITADHGNPLPKHPDPYNSPAKYHIPMLWLGGALKQQGTVNHNFGSQIDISYTLLDLLGGKASDFSWSQNLLLPSDQHYAQYIYNNGFGILNNDSHILYDYNSQSSVTAYGSDTIELKELGKAITQTAYQDYLDRGTDHSKK